MKMILLILILNISYSLFAKELDYKIKIDKSCTKILDIQRNIYETNSEFKINYPQFYCKNKKHCIVKTNELIKLLATSRLHNFKTSNEYQTDKEIANGYFFSFDFIVKCNKFGFVNIVVDSSEFLGGAHPLNSIFIYLANTNEDRIFTLNDLVYPTPEFWDFLSKEVSKSINSPNASIPKREYFTTFTLSDTHLEFTFNEYVIGDYASGSFSGSIPISRIQKFLKPEIKKIYNLK